jgi:hypothetical protein
MNLGHRQDLREGDAEGVTRRELPARARTVGVVVWCSFLAASGATMVLFAFLDPSALGRGEVPEWWMSRHTVYALGFFFFWLIAACSAALATYMARTDRSGSSVNQ